MYALQVFSVCPGVVVRHWKWLSLPQMQILCPPVLFAAADVVSTSMATTCFQACRACCECKGRNNCILIGRVSV